MPKGPHPRHVNEISPEWLTAVLRESGALSDATVIGVEAKVIGEGVGFLSSVGRIRLRYDRNEPHTPESVVVKIEPEMDNFRQIGDELHAFETRSQRWRDLLRLADEAEEIADRWWRERLARPADVAAVLDDAFAARSAVLEARQRAGSAYCTLLAMTGVELEAWPREDVVAPEDPATN